MVRKNFVYRLTVFLFLSFEFVSVNFTNIIEHLSCTVYLYTHHTLFQCREFVKQGSLKANSPAEVVQGCDITFSCVSDPSALKDVSNKTFKVAWNDV